MVSPLDGNICLIKKNFYYCKTDELNQYYLNELFGMSESPNQ